MQFIIDHGVTTTAEDPNFARFLQDGETKFMSMEDMSEFFHSLQPLFNTDASASSVCTEKQKENSETEAVDIQSLVAERSQRDKPKLLSPDAISAPIKQKVFGQDEAIESLAELIVLNRMRKKSKLLTVMLLGPTATGKSETAKSLAEVLSDATGTKYGFIELAGNEFVGEHSVHRFFGAPPGYVGHGQPTALDAVRKNGYHCIVINEVEKADLKLIEGLMEAIDSGYLGMADNSKPSTSIIVSYCSHPISRSIWKSILQQTIFSVLRCAEMHIPSIAADLKSAARLATLSLISHCRSRRLPRLLLSSFVPSLTTII